MIRHLYVHTPFCAKICPYCAFYVHQGGAAAQREFVAALRDGMAAGAGRISPRPGDDLFRRRHAFDPFGGLFAELAEEVAARCTSSLRRSSRSK